jgi:hypothetical protein
MANANILDGFLAPKTPEKTPRPTKQSPSPRTKKRAKQKQYSQIYRSRKRKREQGKKEDLAKAQQDSSDLDYKMACLAAEVVQQARIIEVRTHTRALFFSKMYKQVLEARNKELREVVTHTCCGHEPGCKRVKIS